MQKRQHPRLRLFNHIPLKSRHRIRSGGPRIYRRRYSALNTHAISLNRQMRNAPPNMRMQVNKTRRNDQTLSLYHIPRTPSTNRTLQTGDHTVRNANIQNRMNTLRRIDYRPILDDNVVLHTQTSDE